MWVEGGYNRCLQPRHNAGLGDIRWWKTPAGRFQSRSGISPHSLWQSSLFFRGHIGGKCLEGIDLLYLQRDSILPEPTEGYWKYPWGTFPITSRTTLTMPEIRSAVFCCSLRLISHPGFCWAYFVAVLRMFWMRGVGKGRLLESEFLSLFLW